jgi:hypothetical protein
VKRWVNVKILVGLSMLSSLVLGVAVIAYNNREPREWSLAGHTRQGWPISLRVDDHGKLRTFWTRITGGCSNRTVHGSGTLSYAARYRAADGAVTRCGSPVVQWSADSR